MATATLRAPVAAGDPINASDTGAEAPLLRFVTCGSVDDGKSTLIGRLLHDAGALFDDQVEALAADSRRFGTRGVEPDYALLVDGLTAEREQGITIDVAYRYFSSRRRRYIVADSPGHEQYTRNMVTAASTADLAILLIDATRGLTEQTRRHARIVTLLGIRSVVVAVNKMDLVGHDRRSFDAIVEAFAAFAADDGIGAFTAVPIVAVTGGNIAHRSPAMPWYDGPTLIDLLDCAPATMMSDRGGFVMPVQWVNRPDARFRGFAGTIARGAVKPGDAVTVLPGGQRGHVARIVTFDGDRAMAETGHAVTITLDREIECAAGAMLVAVADQPPTGDTITADLVWFDDQELALGRAYLLQIGATRVNARVEAVVHRVGGAASPAATLATNDIASVRLRTEMPIVALAYADSRALGAFVLIDRASNATVAAGMVRALDAARPATPRSKAPVYAATANDPKAIDAVARLRAMGTPAVLIDEARLRAGVAADLPEDARPALWRRAAAVAALFAEGGVTVVLAIDPPAGLAPLGHPLPADDASAATWDI